MKRIIFWVIILVFMVIGCKSATHRDGYISCVKKPTTEIDLKAGYDNLLVHMVFFPLKEEITEEQKRALILEIEKLEQIDEVNGLSVGNFTDLKDKRALGQYGIAMTMGFKSISDYTLYQNHPIHIHLKKAVAKYLSGPPATYDFNTYEQ